MREALHADCLLCGRRNPAGFKLDFQPDEDGSVSAIVPCSSLLQGYTGFLHGGVSAALLDSAMTNCLFSKGIAAFTGELNLVYKKPVLCGTTARVKAWLEKSYPPLHELKAQLSQNGEVLVSAQARFMESDLLKTKT